MSDAPGHGSGWRRALLLAAGWVFTALGVIGLILPLMPGTVFLIAAAWCFSRSSPRFEAWLLGHERLGPHVLRWRESGVIDRKAKLIACSSMLLSFGLVALTSAPPIALWATGLCLLASGAYVASRPEPAREE
ncbi:YbaN family protein [Bosea caraganae]|uniref:YbaN family protein n=1 Tax=Bosea caraganae TaxID=2763117 RepID=UPI001FE6C9A0|nr:YbaN family protein [Bosea caraganae]